MSIGVETGVQELGGIGASRTKMLREAGIDTVGDLLCRMPRRYEDRQSRTALGSLREGIRTLVRGRISSKSAVNRHGSRMFSITIMDGEDLLGIKFFNQPYLAGTLQEGREGFFFGQVSQDNHSHRLVMINPEVELVENKGKVSLDTGRIVPVYQRIDKISGRMIRKLIFNILFETPGSEELGIEEILPEAIREKYGFPGIRETVRELHFPEFRRETKPEQFIDDLNNWRTPAQIRMVYEEFFLFQSGLVLIREKRRRSSTTRKIVITDKLRDNVRSVLPFRPTESQKKALREIVQDITAPAPMNRLLQGDVGSGKTIVAFQAMMVLMENGFQAAYMAPTEILAEQHFKNFSELLEGTPHQVGFLSSSVKGSRRSKVLEGLSQGKIHLAVGTHSLIQEAVSFDSLGIVVIDEQHRFGVVQRALLAGKVENPEILVMTATPIPRSLAMTLYGDLDVSMIRGVPPGRKPTKTILKMESSRGDVYQLLKDRLGADEQAFVVCPVIEDTGEPELVSAIAVRKEIRRNFPDISVGLLHGKMEAEEKKKVMLDFREFRIRILVSTTVIEVGIDIPNATLMIIEHAERFGLSQLHQLRGRIGRGPKPGTCILMVSAAAGEDTLRRMEFLCRATDGLTIAEKDLELRGPGDYLGTRQAGIPCFRFGNLAEHYELLVSARQDVNDLYRLRRFSPEDQLKLTSHYQKRWGTSAGFLSSV